MNEIIGTAIADDLFGSPEDDIIIGGLGDDFIVGGAGNDSIEGGAGDDGLFGGAEGGNLDSINSIGGRDTLLGGEGDDNYFVSLTTSGGSEIRDSSGEDTLVIAAANTDLDNISFDSSTFGDAAIELSLPQPGIVGLQKSGTELIIDINRDGNAERQNDLTVFNFFNDQGQLGSGAVEIINNIIEPESIVDFFEDQMKVFIEGTDDNDNLTGGLESETLIGGIGDDSLSGSDGDDLLLGDVAERDDEFTPPGGIPGIGVISSEGGNDTLNGGLGNDTLLGQEGNDLILGGSGDDGLFGGAISLILSENNPDIVVRREFVGGRDTLEGGEGNDVYGISLDFSGGSVISDSSGEFDALYIEDASTDGEAIRNGFDVEVFSDPATYGDSAIELSFPQSGIVGLHKSGTELIIDINRDGVAESTDDLTVFNFFDAEGNAGSGSLERINNVVSDEIITFFAENSPELFEGSTVYRFLNNDTGVHFYTAFDEERDFINDNLTNFTSEGSSYVSVDPLTGSSEALPVYRFLNQDTGVHLYTISETERDAVTELDNFSFEGEAFFAYETEVQGSIPIYRFFNTTTGAHFYTPSAAERDNVEDNLSDFQSEGIAYYAFPTE